MAVYSVCVCLDNMYMSRTNNVQYEEREAINGLNQMREYCYSFPELNRHFLLSHL